MGVSCCDDVRGYMDATVCLGGVCTPELAELVLNLDSKYKGGVTANIQTRTIIRIRKRRSYVNCISSISKDQTLQTMARQREMRMVSDSLLEMMRKMMM